PLMAPALEMARDQGFYLAARVRKGEDVAVVRRLAADPEQRQAADDALLPEGKQPDQASAVARRHDPRARPARKLAGPRTCPSRRLERRRAMVVGEQFGPLGEEVVDVFLMKPYMHVIQATRFGYTKRDPANSRFAQTLCER